MIVLSVIIPANNEEEFLQACLEGLFSQDLKPEAAANVEIIVAANACSDKTVEIGESNQKRAAEKGFQLVVLDLEKGGKLYALNEADRIARGPMRAYLDADVILQPDLLRLTLKALNESGARYVSGALKIPAAKSFVSRHYAKLWSNLPYVTGGVTGAGFFAVNKDGRARWETFPDIIADDVFVRLLFKPNERIRVQTSYCWPVIEGFWELVKVRDRQNRGVAEIYEKYPHLEINEDKAALTVRLLAKLLLTMPVSLTVYCCVIISARFSAKQKSGGHWTRGR